MYSFVTELLGFAMDSFLVSWLRPKYSFSIKLLGASSSSSLLLQWPVSSVSGSLRLLNRKQNVVLSINMKKIIMSLVKSRIIPYIII